MSTGQSLAGEAEKIAALLRGYYRAQAVYVAARLGIADHLAAAARAGAVADARGANTGLSTTELAALTGAHADSLYRMMRALASEGLFEERADGRFSLTMAGQLLRCDVPGTMRPAALVTGEMQYKVWAAFRESVKSGTPGFDRIFRQPLFPFFEEHPDLFSLFNQAMTQHAAQLESEVVGACRIHDAAAPGECDTIVDVGGGLGNMLAALLRAHPAARGVLLDGAGVIGAAREALRDSGVLERLQFVTGDFFRTVPRGNVMLLGSILHMFNDGEAAHILRNCRAALVSAPRPGRVYVVERLMAGLNEPDPAKWDDLNMMVMTGGRERTFEQYAALLRDAGMEKAARVGAGIIEAQA